MTDRDRISTMVIPDKKKEQSRNFCREKVKNREQQKQKI